VRVSVELDWTFLGEVRLAQKLKFPEQAPKQPGVYRFVLRSSEGESVYIGEALLLDRRFAHYQNPGPTQTTNSG
jgi:excinuclease UvrABC nuclease subunit